MIKVKTNESNTTTNTVETNESNIPLYELRQNKKDFEDIQIPELDLEENELSQALEISNYDKLLAQLDSDRWVIKCQSDNSNGFVELFKHGQPLIIRLYKTNKLLIYKQVIVNDFSCADIYFNGQCNDYYTFRLILLLINQK